MLKFAIIFISLVCLRQTWGHGMMLDPPNRSSLWRFDDSAPVNFNDNENFCGGYNVHFNQNDGHCGICGDNYADPQPRANENTGIYGQGKIVANYSAGEEIEIYSLITANHLGHLSLDLCELVDRNAPEPGESCFSPVMFSNGLDKHNIRSTDLEVVTKIRLPQDFRCEHCVLRWTYTSGNNWGQCDDGRSGKGCGPQETFKSCSDISIY